MVEQETSKNPFLRLPIEQIRQINEFVDGHNKKRREQEFHKENIRKKLELGYETKIRKVQRMRSKRRGETQMPLSIRRRARLERELSRLEASQNKNNLQKRVKRFMGATLHIKRPARFFK